MMAKIAEYCKKATARFKNGRLEIKTAILVQQEAAHQQT